MSTLLKILKIFTFSLLTVCGSVSDMYFFIGQKKAAARGGEKPGYFNGIDDLLLLMGVSSASALLFGFQGQERLPLPPRVEFCSFSFLVVVAAAGGTGGTKTKKTFFPHSLSLSPPPPLPRRRRRKHTKK